MVMLTAEQKAIIKQTARDAEMEVSAWVRRVLMEAAKRGAKHR
jgi:hypothetical protein